MAHGARRRYERLVAAMVLDTSSVMKNMGGAAGWAEWAMAHPKFWLGGPQCIWPTQ